MFLRNDQIAIVHGASPNIAKELTKLTFPNHANYALLHGYKLCEFEFEPSESSWGKIRVLQELFADSNIRRAFWIDADAIFTDLDLCLTEHLPLGKIVVACDILGINSGCLWLENCPEVRRFLWVVGNQGHRFRSNAPIQYQFFKPIFRDQSPIHYFSQWPLYQELFTYVSPNKMNAYLNENYLDGRPQDGVGQWQVGDFILHLPGIPNSKRISILKNILSRTQRAQ